MKSNPTPALPLSGEGVTTLYTASPSAKEEGVKRQKEIDADVLAPPPDKGEAGRGLKPPKLHNLKSQKNTRRQLRKNPTEPEKRFWSWVRGKQLGTKFRRQQGIGRYIVDFYCAEYALVIEIDGDSHFNDNAIAKDTIRTEFLQAKGLRVIRFTNRDIMQNQQGVLMQWMVTLKEGYHDK